MYVINIKMWAYVSFQIIGHNYFMCMLTDQSCQQTLGAYNDTMEVKINIYFRSAYSNS